MQNQSRRPDARPFTRAAVRLAACLAVCPAAAASPALAADPAQVQHAIDRGRDYLFAAEKDGTWEPVVKRDLTDTDPYSVRNGQWGGMTAIATLALLATGVGQSDPHLRPAIEFLKSAEVRGNYAAGVRAQVWGQLPPDPVLHRAELADADRLIRAMHQTRTGSAGFYGYLAASKPDEYDHSVSQFAALGVWTLAQAGCEVPTAYWRVTDAAWRRQQRADGGWCYWEDGTPGADGQPQTTLSMTAAGVATLYLAQEYTRMAPQCRGNVDDKAIDAGLKLLGDRLTSLGQDRRWYTVWGVSRVGLASGYKRLGTTDWFQFGADLAVADQRPDGSWHNQRENENVNAVADTAFALLFLSRGRAPIMLNKLAYADAAGKPGPWNQRPRDAANLARWVGRQIESPLAWQVVGLRDPAADLHDAPVLYMAGGDAPHLSDADVAKLRAYCEDGGLILGHADCGSGPFAKGFERLGEQLFPGRHFRSLEPSSPIYTDQTFSRDRWPNKPPVRALTNGARELMVLLPAGDPARQWQGQSFQPAAKDVYGQLLIDLFLYAVDKQGLRRRGETYIVDRRADVPASATVKLARLRYDGNWDPEPGGWRRLANVLHNARVADLDVHPLDPAVPGQLTAGGFKLASLTVGDPNARLTDAARSALRDYVKAGGTLLVDAAGGRSGHRAAAEAELARLFPDAPTALAVLPPDAAVYATLSANPSLAVGPSVEYRRFERSNRSLRRPQLRAVTINNRPAVFYSPEDLSVGLVGQPVGGVAGYVPSDATKIAAAVVAFAAKSP